MANWKYKLKSGKALRDAINAEDNVDTLNALRDCFEEIHRAMPDMYDEDELEDDINEIENQLDNCENYADYDMTLDDVEDAVNYMLEEFYDLCDAYRIWVDI